MDIFLEDIVKCGQSVKNKLCVFGLYFAALIVSLILLTVVVPISFQLGAVGSMVSTFSVLAVAGAWWGARFLAKGFYVEYEYILTNSEMDIDKIMAKTRRKRIISFDFKDIELCAPVDDINYKHEFENTEGFSKVMDLSGAGEERTKYFINMSGDNGRVRLVINPRDKIMESAYKYNPRKVTLKKS